MSRPLLIVLVLFLLAVGAVLLVPVLVDKDKVLQLAATTLHNYTGATLTVDGDADLSVFPTLGVALSDAAVAMPGKQQPDVRIGTLRIGVQFLPLLRRQLEIDSIELDGVRASMESGPGRASAATSAPSDQDLDALYEIRRKRMAASAAATASATSAEAALLPPLALHVKKLTVTDARLDLLDPGGATPRVIELVRLQASDLNLDDTPIPVDITLRIPGKQVVAASLKGGLRLNQQRQTATLEQVEATVTGALASPLQLRTRGAIDLARQSADLKLEIALGDTRGDGTLRYSSFESPQIDSVLHFNLWNPALLALAAPDSLAAAGQQSSAASGDKPLPLDTLRAIDARTDLTIDKAQFGAHTVNNLQARLRALDGLIQVTELTGDLYGGKLQASATLDGKHNNVTLDTRGSLSRADMAAALAASAAKPVLTGSASVDWQLHGEGQSKDALTAAMRGPLKLTTEEVVLTGVSVEKLLCQAVALSNKEQLTASFPADTRFTTLTADVQIDSGKAALNPLRAALAQITLNGDGTYDLQNRNFSATLKARLLPELEQLDHACRVSKRLAAIDLPVNCAGTVGSPPATWCRVDAAKIVQDLGVNEVREKFEKKAGKLLDKLFNKKD